MECKQCHTELTRIPWDDYSDVFVCDNFNCPRFRQPISAGSVEYDLSYLNTLKKKERPVRKKRHEYEDESFSKELQKLRNDILSKE